MPKKKTSKTRTVLGDCEHLPDDKMEVDEEQIDLLSAESQAKFNDTNSKEYAYLKKWYDRRLAELSYLALGRKELKEAFCATAEKLSKKPKLREKSGKIWLLEHFAILAESYKPKEILNHSMAAMCPKTTFADSLESSLSGRFENKNEKDRTRSDDWDTR